MVRRPPRSTRTDTRCPYTTLFRSVLALAAVASPFRLPIPVAPAHSYKLEDIAIGHIWAPPPEEESPSGIAVYGPVLNQGSAPARLVGATSPVAGKVRFRTESEGEVRWPDTIEFHPDKPLDLAPWRAPPRSSDREQTRRQAREERGCL